MSLTIYAVGDLMFGEKSLCYNFGVKSIIRNKGVDYLFKNLKDIFENGDIIFGNLEAPISNYTNKKGFKADFFRANPDVIKGLKNANFNVLSVANNHIMEHGEEAFLSTIHLLKKNNIIPGGISNNALLEIKGSKVAIMAYSFIEDFVSNPLYNRVTSEKDILEDVKKIKSSVDIIILSLHWGSEFTDKPSLFQVKFAHEAIDAGADIILGHHPHVLQGIEKYHNGIIAYSLGNFIFDMWQKRLRNTMILRVDLLKNGIGNIEVIPIHIKDDYQPEILCGEEATSLLWKIKNLSVKSMVSDQPAFDRDMLKYTKEVAINRKRYRSELKWFFLRNLYRYPPKFIFQIAKGYLSKELKILLRRCRIATSSKNLRRRYL